MKLEISYLMTKAEPHEPLYGQGSPTLRMRVQMAGTVDVRVALTLYGYGSGEAILNVYAESGCEQEHVDGIDWEVIAKALVWASPTTIAHLVMEAIRGQ